MCRQEGYGGGQPAPADNDVTDLMRSAGAAVLRRFYRQPFQWLAAWEVEEIYLAMNAARFPHVNLERVIAMQRQLLERGTQVTKRYRASKM
jgi:hypothetical protein